MPLASHHGLAIEPAEALAEGAPLEGVLALMKEHADNGAVLLHARRHHPGGTRALRCERHRLGGEPRCEKGSIWVLDGDVTGAPTARYIPAT